jgi:hypothetical protein
LRQSAVKFLSLRITIGKAEIQEPVVSNRLGRESLGMSEKAGIPGLFFACSRFQGVAIAILHQHASRASLKDFPRSPSKIFPQGLGVSGWQLRARCQHLFQESARPYLGSGIAVSGFPSGSHQKM